MAKLLNGSELVGYIKERQAHQVRALRQTWRVIPRLVILKSKGASPVINTYVRLKQRYSEDILIETEVRVLSEPDMPTAVDELNRDPRVHGIIIQLPLDDPPQTDTIVNHVAPQKDVDGLGREADFDSATATAINWLLAGYGIELQAKKIAIVGNGRLVGAPLADIWKKSGYNVTVLDSSYPDIGSVVRASDIVITATGTPRLITKDMIGIGAVVVDAGTASEDGMLRGDVDPALRERDDITITPEKGGVGPLTIAAIFDNVIRSALKSASHETH